MSELRNLPLLAFEGGCCCCLLGTSYMSIFEKLLSPFSVTHMYVRLRLFTRIEWLNKGLVFVKDWILLSQQPLIDCIYSSMVGWASPREISTIHISLSTDIVIVWVLLRQPYCCYTIVVPFLHVYKTLSYDRHPGHVIFYNFSSNLLQSFLSFMLGGRILLYQLKVGGQLVFIFASFRFL